jgi:vanillate O-demethylase monooxygenase subunit
MSEENKKMAYLRNTWYVAAWDEEVKPNALFSRRLLGEALVFFREQSGQVRALADRCAHRFAPLSKGTLCKDVVRCPYHGLEFDGEGQCTRNPHGNGAIPKAAQVRAYPVVEKYSVIWIWMGDAEKADEALIPDFSCMDPQRFYVAKRYLHARANYVLESETSSICLIFSTCILRPWAAKMSAARSPRSSRKAQRSGPIAKP